MKPLSILFVCAGNTCRSPLAAAVAHRRFADHGIEVASAGLQAVAGLPASEKSLLVGATLGLDLERHRSRPLTPELAARVEWIIAMTRQQVEELRRRFPVGGPRLGLLGLPGIDLARDPAQTAGEEIEDPYGQPLSVYHEMADRIVRLVTAWEAHLTSGRAEAGTESEEGGAG